jgi:HEAT repeat protein
MRDCVIFNCTRLRQTASRGRLIAALVGLTGACTWCSTAGPLAAAENPPAKSPAPAPATDSAASGVRIAIESLHLGSIYSYYNPPAGQRFLAVELNVANHGTQPLKIRPRDMTLNVEGTDYRLREAVGGLRNGSFQVRGRTVAITRMQPLTDLDVAPGASEEKWIVFGGMEPGSQVPRMLLRIAAAGATQEVDINDVARQELRLTVERIGPRGCLALLTIGGELNTVNAGSLVSTLESLVAQKVVRAVIRFDRSASHLDGQMVSWLQQGAFLAGRADNANAQMPAFPAALRELHLAGLPRYVMENLEGVAGDEPRIHRRDATAVRAALKSAIESLPRAELLTEIEKGHPLVRSAALADGGSRLTAEDLPLVLRFADGDDVRMQLAAITALRHFGEPAAIDKLLLYARKNVEPTASAAIESLAASRYAVAHQALLNVLNQEHPASRRIIVRVLAKYPRPLWADTIYSFIGDPDPEVAVVALRALVETGHPRLLDLLKDALSRGSPQVREEAFLLLSKRSDPQSEALAVEYALQSMKSGVPSSSVYELINRTKDPRAIPLLLSALDRASGNRAQIINVLAQIGDPSVGEALAAKYPSFSDRDKSATLNALQILKSPHFRHFAGEALIHGETSLVNTAINGLQQDGSPQAVQLLVVALESSKSPTAWSYLTSALANLGTGEAKLALNHARDSDNPRKRKLAIDALRLLSTHSPGYPAFLTARQYAQSEHWDDAIARYGTAIELDPELADAYSGRGHAYLQTKKLAEAHKDFAKAVELDPYSAEGVSGLGICQVMDGDIAKGTKTIEDSRSKLNDDVIFTYNAACVYGRALEQTSKLPTSPERDKKSEDFRKKALADLRLSVKLGFPDIEWMKKDADLESLHGSPEFKRIVSPDDKHGDDSAGDDNTNNNANNADPQNGDEDAAKSAKGKTAGKSSTGKPAGKTATGKQRGPRSTPMKPTPKKQNGAETKGGDAVTDDAARADQLFEEARP